MELDEALQQITQIRQQMARSEMFRGYRSQTIAYSGIVGLIAAACQPFIVPAPAVELERYLILWIAIAGFCAAGAGWELYRRALSGATRTEGASISLAVEQFLPSLVVGALVTACIYRGSPQIAWVLPGLWSIFFGLGIFASARILPWQVMLAGMYYVACGCCWLRWGQAEDAFSPWQMAISFGGGQLLCAVIMYFTLERRHAA